MNVTKFSEEAVRLNVSIQDVRSIYEKSLSDGKIKGLIVPKKDEIIRFSDEEIDVLATKLDAGKVSLGILTTELNLMPYQVRTIFDYLLKKNKINGVLTDDDIFISNSVLRKEIINEAEKNESIDAHVLSSKLTTTEKSINSIMDNLSYQILSSVSTYSKIGFADLAREANLPENVTKLFLKKLIQDEKLVGQLDMVNNVLTLEKVKPSSRPIEDNQSTLYSRPLSNPPSDAWYIVPLFFGFLGGLISYFIVDNDDHGKAVNLFWFGVIMSVIDALIAWAYWSWVMSLFHFI